MIGDDLLGAPSVKRDLTACRAVPQRVSSTNSHHEYLTNAELRAWGGALLSTTAVLRALDEALVAAHPNLGQGVRRADHVVHRARQPSAHDRSRGTCLPDPERALPPPDPP